MNKKHLLSMSAAALLVGHPAIAAQAATQEPGAADAPAEIIVTAQKRAQNLQDVSLSISALSAQKLTDNQISDVTDLAASVPNVTVGNGYGLAQITIRGIGVTNPFTGADPSVALHVDGAVVAQSAAQIAAFFDLERIEVLRGPQGTLYGRNATGGVVNLITAKPTRDLTGYIRATYGNFDLITVEAAVGGPIAGDKVLGRIAVRTEDRSGYGINEFSGREIDDAKHRAIRGHVQFLPTEDVSLLLTGDWYREDDSAFGPKFRAESYPGTTIPQLVAASTPATRASNTNRNIKSEIDTQNARETWAITATLDWQLNESMKLRSLTNYRSFFFDTIWDFDTASNVSNSVQAQYVTSKHYSEELQLTYDSGPVNALLAAYYYNEKITGDNRVGTRPRRRTAPGLQGLFLSFQGKVDVESYALFGNVSYDLTDQLVLNAGGRYTHEKRTGVIFTTIVPVSPNPTRFATGGSFNDFSPKVTLEWRPVDDVMLYGTWSKGFKSGIILVGAASPILEPEKVTNYEIGLKSTFLDRALTFNLSAFYADYRNLQVSKVVPAVSTPTVMTIFENAAEATMKGLEAEIVVVPAAGLQFDSSIGYLDARFDDYLSANALELPNAPIRQLKGRRLPFAPKWSVAAGAQYTAELGNGAELRIRGDLNYKSRFFSDQYNNFRLSETYTTVDANIRYTSPGRRFFGQLWVKNLTDEFYWAGSAANGTSRMIMGNPGEPRTYGATIGYNF